MDRVPIMQPDPYEALKKALANVGLVGERQNQWQLVVSCQAGPVWPDRGNSFWLSHTRDTWYLGTWSSVCYKVSTDQDVAALCVRCMSLGTSAMYRVPQEIVERFKLQELGEDECDRLFSTGAASDEWEEFWGEKNK
jgi:hypothetical protein